MTLFPLLAAVPSARAHLDLQAALGRGTPRPEALSTALRRLLHQFTAVTLILFIAFTAYGESPYGLSNTPHSHPYLNLPTNDHRAAPKLLSETGAFKDVRALTPTEGLIPYELNVPFWSDGAGKSRWISLPRTNALPAPRITFSETGEWAFPAGTVFIKHFELPPDETRPALHRRLETRLLVRDDSGGIYGVAYRWRPDNSDADRVDEPRLEPLEIKTSSGMRKQNWYFPGPGDCRTCHTPQAGLVLGVKTRQLNRTLTYPSTGVTDNQLRVWNHVGLFDPPPNDRQLAQAAKLAPTDDSHASLEDRARSYLDANCAHCHRPGGVAGFFDARYDTPLSKQNLIDGPVLINLGLDRARVIAPHDPWRSVLLSRLTTLEQPKMPPLAHETFDTQGAALIKKWIEGLPGPVVLAPPTISPPGGQFKTAVKVELKHADPAAVIHYTLDGSVPGKSSAMYTGPIELAAPTTLRARALKDGVTRSIAVYETFIVGE